MSREGEEDIERILARFKGASAMMHCIFACLHAKKAFSWCAWFSMLHGWGGLGKKKIPFGMMQAYDGDMILASREVNLLMLVLMQIP